MAVDDNNGGLTPGGRFARMEETLFRIESKLDTKVDRDDFLRLDARTSALESGQTPLGIMLMKQFEGVQTRLETLERQGSGPAQEAEALAREALTKAETLEKEASAREAVVKAERQAAVSRFDARMVVFGALSAGSAVGTVLMALLH